jgi:hypothetical protein
MVVHLNKNLSIFYGIRRSITESTKAHCGIPILSRFNAGRDITPHFKAVHLAAHGPHEFRQLVL